MPGEYDSILHQNENSKKKTFAANNQIKVKANLNFMEGFLLSERGVIIGDKMASRDLTFRIIFHMESNGATSLGATADMIELKAH
jgi:hypothetical protein